MKKNHRGHHLQHAVDVLECRVVSLSDGWNEGSVVKKIALLPSSTAETELLHLATRTDCPLDPARLVCSILVYVDDQENFQNLFENPKLVQYYNYT